jgi:hypothetical protein
MRRAATEARNTELERPGKRPVAAAVMSGNPATTLPQRVYGFGKVTLKSIFSGALRTPYRSTAMTLSR